MISNINPYLKSVYVIFFCLWGISCSSYRTLNIEILQAPHIAIDSGKHIAFLDRNIIYKNDSAFFLYDYEGIGRNDLTYLFYTGIRDAFLDSEKFDSLMPMSGVKPVYIEDVLQAPAFHNSDIRKVCDVFGLDYLIVLENSCYRTNPKEQTVSHDFFIRLYSREAAYPIDSVVYSDDLTGILSDDYDFVNYISTNSYLKGLKYGHRIVPYWENNVRRVYNRGKIMRMADIFLQNNETDEALNLWEAMTHSSDRKALQACLNMAWVYENSGDFNAAAKLLEQAEELLKSGIKTSSGEIDYLNEYQNIIRQRIKGGDLMGN